MTAANKDELRLSPTRRRTLRQNVAQQTAPDTSFVVQTETLPADLGGAFRCSLWCKPLLSCILMFCLSGCGNSFTYGGIPEGKSVVRGRVVAADNPQLPLVRATVTLLSTPTGETTQALSVLTDAQGQFSISGINTGKRPNGTSPTVSNVVVSVDMSKTAYQSQKVAFLLTADRPASVVLAVPPTNFDLTQVGTVSIKYSSTSTAGANGANGGLVPGSELTFTAQLLDRSGNPLVSGATGQTLTPSLTLDGLAVDAISPNGLFQASLFPPTGVGGTAGGPGGTTSPIGVGSTVSVTGSVNLPGAAPSVGTPLFVPIVASPTTATDPSAKGTFGASAPSTSFR